MHTEVSGKFVKIILASNPDVYLERGNPDRPPARFNRKGQDALYLSPDLESAKVAVGQDVQPGDPPRFYLTFQLQTCALFDLRTAEASRLYERARQPWRARLAAGFEPSSWNVADQLRREGHIGLIDPSRRRHGLWHVTLFRWNEEGAPSVHRIDGPTVINVEPNYR